MAALAQLHLNTGQKVSAGLHVGLVLWIMLFDLFAAPDDSMIPEVTEVSLISAQDFAALTQPEPPAPVPTPAPAPAPAPAIAGTTARRRSRRATPR